MTEPAESPALERHAEALRRIPTRASQVLSQTVLRRRSFDEAAAHYGISRPAFTALLARSLIPLLDVLGVAHADEEPVARSLDAWDRQRPSVPEDAVFRILLELQETGPQLVARQQAGLRPESWRSTLLRVATVAALIAAALFLSRYFE